MTAQPATPTAPNPGQAQTRSRRPSRMLIVAVIAAIVVAILVWRGIFAESTPANVVIVSGRIEGDDAAVASKLSGRIVEVRVREGDAVKAGDVIAVLDDEQVRAREEQARAAVMQAEARARAAHDQVAVLQEQVRQAQLQTDQAKVDAAGRVKQAEADLAAAEAQLAQQKAAYDLAIFDRDAYLKLAQTGAVAERQAKVAVSTAEQQAAALAAAQRRVDAAQGSLTTARANLTNPMIRESATVTLGKQLTQQEAEVSSAVASTEQARAQLMEAQANRADLTIRAPFAGTVVTRS